MLLLVSIKEEKNVLFINARVRKGREPPNKTYIEENMVAFKFDFT